MKKAGFFINLAAAALLTTLVSFFFWKLYSNSRLRQQLELKKEELKELRSRGRRAGESERQQWESLNKMVPTGESQPLALIKTLIHIGGEIGLKNAVFSIKEVKKQPDVSMGQTFAAPQQASAGPQLLPRPLDIEINFEAAYLQILGFLKKLMDLERIVAVKGILIERKKEILPYQKVTLVLVAYTFLNQ